MKFVNTKTIAIKRLRIIIKLKCLQTQIKSIYGYVICLLTISLIIGYKLGYINNICLVCYLLINNKLGYWLLAWLY